MKKGKNMKFCLYAIFFLIVTSLITLAQPEGRMVVLGLDGLDFELTQSWMAQGKLPHLQKLSQQGSFFPLATSNPAQSPVAWATMATGTNPGQHRIYDFLRRGDGDYQPRLGMVEVENWAITGWWLRIGFCLLFVLIFCVFVWGMPTYLDILKKMRRVMILFGVASTIAVYIILEYNLPWTIPVPKALKQGQSVWSIAAEHGIKTVVLDAPMAFPAEAVQDGQLYCGLGVPDVAGTNGLWFHYSTMYQARTPTETGGWKMPLTGSGNVWQGELLGPRNLLIAEQLQNYEKKLAAVQTSINQGTYSDQGYTIPPTDNNAGEHPKGTWEANSTSDSNIKKQAEYNDILQSIQELQQKIYVSTPLQIRIVDQQLMQFIIKTQVVTEVSQGQWSPWITAEFEMSRMIKLKGMFKIRILQVNPPEFYITPVQFDPWEVPLNISISSPRSFSNNLTKQHGRYATLGWPEATNAIKDGLIPEQVFWEDMKQTFDERRKIYEHELAQQDWQLMMAFFYAPDRAGHIYWRFFDPQHPDTKNPELQAYRDRMLQTYQLCDDLVGYTMRQLNPNDILIVISDHGFAAFQWEVNLNTWLLKNGYLKLKQNTNSRRLQINDLYNDRSALCQQIDWEQTKVYSMGLGSLYLNLRGREPQGIVEPGLPAKELAKELAQKLPQLRHNGQSVIQHVYLREEIYQGSYQNESPDLVIGFCKGYRVSWQSTLGAVPPDIIEPNILKWSGDHCSLDPSLIPGVLFSNCPLEFAAPASPLSNTTPSSFSPHLLDIAPTILQWFAVPIPQQMEGKSMVEKK